MPTDASAGDGNDLPVEVPEDEFTFAAHDLGRGRAPEQLQRDLGFAPSRTVDPPVADPSDDGFVIHQPQSPAPAAPVDALVVGAPEPALADVPPPAAHAFRISSATAVAAPSPAAELWTPREPATEAASVAPATPSRRGWSTRNSELVDRSANATMLRLREEAVNVSWKAAWMAVTAANPRLLRKRGTSAS
ncbi:MAG: hypothetical protein JF886_00705 [Candidatus Dormibacteraeota bacterium]|uniref:Uncharacterized protein n=1 Tax=Candidatus Aeolococcus gillhamiae TaxID=3127015 RepID=A0A934N8M9_9BACT|nr:hypothetical protein [Candidatus Dormibacteraeota bacterium]